MASHPPSLPNSIQSHPISPNPIPSRPASNLVQSLPISSTLFQSRPIRLEGLFSDALAPHSQLMRTDPKHATLLASGLLIRGNVTMSDVQRNLARLRPQLRLPFWNPDGVKARPPPPSSPPRLLATAATLPRRRAAPLPPPPRHVHAALALCRHACLRAPLAAATFRFPAALPPRRHHVPVTWSPRSVTSV